ncbi:MAG: glycosyltransferase, partial [Candidatus Hydrogenedentes bacterium]|nr:glycosyltransferase [Candidatus Hydrogenedentota bacterium]
LHVYKDFDPPVCGGIERHVALMCRFQRQRAEVEALVCSRTLRTCVVERDGTRVTEAGEWGRLLSAPLAPSFPWLMRRSNADVVVVHVPNPTAELGWLLARPRTALVVRYHSDVVRQARSMKLYGPLQMHFLRQAAIILPTSQPYLESSSMLQAVRDRCRVVPLGIVPEEFEAPEESQVQALHQRYGEDFVFFCGMHRYYKGLQYLVEAAPQIKARLVLAGDGPERGALMRQAQATASNIVFPGRLTHEALVAHLHACAVFVFPSVERSEAFGVSIMEAHACGKPVVATRLGTGVEVVNQDVQTGLNVPPRDPAALAEAVNTLLTDRARRERMGAYAKARVAREFRAEDVARLELEYYQEALSGREARI